LINFGHVSRLVESRAPWNIGREKSNRAVPRNGLLSGFVGIGHDGISAPSLGMHLTFDGITKSIV
jgi:hypothetical protein